MVEKATLMRVFTQRIYLSIRPIVVLLALLRQLRQELRRLGEVTLPRRLIIDNGIRPKVMFEHHVMYPFVMLSLLLILICAVFST